jgi:hypothetical protein
MISLNSSQAIRTCGLLWLLAGFSLLRKGLILTSDLILNSHLSSNNLFPFLTKLTGTAERAGVALVIISVGIGLIKANKVLNRAAIKNVDRLKNLQRVSPVSLFDQKLWIVILAMVGVAAGLNFLKTPSDWRAFIDIAVGVALLQGASTYFRLARSLNSV